MNKENNVLTTDCIVSHIFLPVVIVVLLYGTYFPIFTNYYKTNH